MGETLPPARAVRRALPRERARSRTTTKTSPAATTTTAAAAAGSCKTAERRLARAVDRSRPGPAPGCGCARAGDGARRPPGRTSRAQDMAQVGPRAAAPTGHLVNSLSFFCRKTENTEEKFVFRNECDAEGLGSLDRDAFAQGMARIDEELRRAQVLGRAGTGSDANGRTPRLAPSRPILR